MSSGTSPVVELARRARAGRALVLTAFVLLSATPLLAKAPVVITFEERAVIAQVTPGSSTVWFVIAQEPTGRGTKLIHRSDLIDDEDQDGVVRVTLPHPVVPSSVWTVVDLTSGNHAIAAPFGVPLRKHLPVAALMGRGNGKAARLLQKELLTVFMVARPGVGAWLIRVEDGAAADGDDAPDGGVTALLEKMAAIGKSPPPPQDFQRDDVVVFANPLTLTVYDTRVVK